MIDTPTQPDRVHDLAPAPERPLMASPAPADVAESGDPLARAALSVAALSALAACGGGGGGAPSGGSPGLVTVPAADLPGAGGPPPAAPGPGEQPASADAARFLTQATFGIQSTRQIADTQQKGFARWLWEQFNTGFNLHTSYLDQQKLRNVDDKGVARAQDEMSYEAVWQQWLYEPGQLRARMAFALGQIVVISNIAPDLRPYAMSSYMDMLNRHAFGNYRDLLRAVALHPAMGYYLNMVNSERDNAETGAHPNENFAREVLQLFSVGLVKLNQDGSQQVDGAGRPVPTYDEAVVQGFAKAFTGWSFANATRFGKADESADEAWVAPMKPFADRHSPESKLLLDGVTLPAGQSPEKDLDDAISNIFNHPNVGPFVGRQLIQRLVTSNPSPAYIARVTAVFNDNGAGVRGDLRAVVSAILLDAEARAPVASTRYGKQREPVIRFANFLRAFNARSASGRNAIHYLEDADNGLGQSPLLAPSVFNFFSPNFRPAGAIAQAGLVAPEFQITTETTVVGGLNFFAQLFNQGGYGWGENELRLDLEPLKALAASPDALIAELNALFFNQGMSARLQARMKTMLSAITSADPARQASRRVRAALTLTSLSPEFVIQK